MGVTPLYNIISSFVFSFSCFFVGCDGGWVVCLFLFIFVVGFVFVFFCVSLILAKQPHVPYPLDTLCRRKREKKGKNYK